MNRLTKEPTTTIFIYGCNNTTHARTDEQVLRAGRVNWSNGHHLMTEKPILFSSEMVNAILDGRKSQTRRIAKLPFGYSFPPARLVDGGVNRFGMDMSERVACPYGGVGDVLWVRETWKTCAAYDFCAPNQIDSGAAVQWLAGGKERLNGPRDFGKTRASIHMPCWACRIRLRITAIRCERLQSISGPDATAEGIRVPKSWETWSDQHAILEYKAIWDRINGEKYPWSSNPWVWCISFERIK